MGKRENKLTSQLIGDQYKMPRQAPSPKPFPESRVNYLQQQGYNIIQSRRLKYCSVNTSHSKALAFQYSTKPLATNLDSSSRDNSKK